jgi:hypothetical protein
MYLCCREVEVLLDIWPTVSSMSLIDNLAVLTLFGTLAATPRLSACAAITVVVQYASDPRDHSHGTCLPGLHGPLHRKPDATSAIGLAVAYLFDGSPAHSQNRIRGGPTGHQTAQYISVGEFLGVGARKIDSGPGEACCSRSSREN